MTQGSDDVAGLVAKVLRLDREATVGEWEIGKDRPDDAQGYGGYLYSLHVFGPPPKDEDDEPKDIAWCSCSQDPSQDGENAPKLKRARENAKLIALYRTAAPALAREVERLKAQNEKMREALATVLGTGSHGQNMTWTERCSIGRAALNEGSRP